MTRKERLRKQLRLAVEDGVSDILYYGRKEDEDLSREDVQEMFSEGWINNDELVRWFAEALGKVHLE